MPQPPVCAMCGRAADPVSEGDPPLGWTVQTEDARREPSGVSRICPTCTREHVRAIEAKLDRAWW